jgi:hypothetical protein
MADTVLSPTRPQSSGRIGLRKEPGRVRFLETNSVDQNGISSSEWYFRSPLSPTAQGAPDVAVRKSPGNGSGLKRLRDRFPFFTFLSEVT